MAKSQGGIHPYIFCAVKLFKYIYVKKIYCTRIGKSILTFIKMRFHASLKNQSQLIVHLHPFHTGQEKPTNSYQHQASSSVGKGTICFHSQVK